ncbi:MAG: deoxyhypusine synthase [Candidatus Aenigmarchaeota archaeon]|nr:deoxyhypusine synthase [Candidatus Aenigmarchaeota archaeon]
MKAKVGKAKGAVFKKSSALKGIDIKGYDFENGLDFDRFLENYMSTGFQATNLARAIQVVKKMREDNVTIFFGYTSNMVSSGIRDVIQYLVKNRLVQVLVTTAGGIEEDIIKCLKPFVLGRFDAKGAELREKGINRIGNVFVPNDRYIKFEKFMNIFLSKMLEKQKKENRVLSPSEIIRELGKEINNEQSIYYWAYKNDIPVFCPALTDGSFGDMTYFFKKKNKDFRIDMVDDLIRINDIAINAEKTGIILLGAGLIKHHICNANLFRDGADYAVYINTAQEFDGSDAGARPDEAVSWGKIRPEAKSVKVYGDATIIFPLVVAGAFRK